MAFEISCPICTSLGTELTIAGAMKLALAHAPQHSPVYIVGDGARFTIRHDGKPAIEVAYDAMLASYQRGLETLLNLLAARRELSRARFVEADTRLQLLTASVVLAFTTGESPQEP